MSLPQQGPAGQQAFFPIPEFEVPNLRLFEPIESLHLTPSSLKAAKASGANIVQDLMVLLSEQNRPRSLGHGHVEEIRRKVDQFLSFQTQGIDWSSLVRIALSTAEARDRSVLATHYGLTALFPPLSSHAKETPPIRIAEADVAESVHRVKERISTSLASLLSVTYKAYIKPALINRGGIIHRTESLSFLSGLGEPLPFDLFTQSIHLLEALSSQSPLFSAYLLAVTDTMFAISEDHQKWAFCLIEDAKSLAGTTIPSNLRDLANAISRCRLAQWDHCQTSMIENILFWHYFR